MPDAGQDFALAGAGNVSMMTTSARRPKGESRPCGQAEEEMTMSRMPSCSRRMMPWILATVGLLAGCDDSIRNSAFSSLQVTPEEVSFPKVSVGESAERKVKVENIGAGDLKIANLDTTLSNEFAIYWTLSTAADGAQRIAVENGVNSFDGVVTVPPGEHLEIIVSFAPATDDAVGGTITFESNDPDHRDVTVPVKVIAGGPELNLNPTIVDFERVPAGQSAERSILATNIGQEPLIMDALRLDGSQDFTLTINGEDPVDNPAVLDDPDQDGEPGLAPESSFEVVVTFAPDADESSNGLVVFVSNDRIPERTVEVRANGATPCINVVPGTLEFGAALIGRDNRRRVTIESCGGEALRLEAIELVDDGGGVFALDDDTLPPLPSQLPALDRTVEPPVAPSRGITVLFTPDSEEASAGMVVITTNDPAVPMVEVPLIGRGTLNDCPEARVTESEYIVLPLDIVTLDASNSVDADWPAWRQLRYEWTVISRPQGSTAVPVEQFHNPLRPADGGPPDSVETPTAQFFVDLTGEYIIELRVVDNLEAVAPSDVCEQPPAQVRILAEPDEDIHVQMVWDTPGDDTAPVNPQTDADGTDVDLWFLHPNAQSWSDISRRCYYGNSSPDWGVLGQVDDNPSLDIDDVNGAGPENINLNNPENTQMLGSAYRVGAHYYRSFREAGLGDYGPSLVTMRIYLGGALAFEADRELIDTEDFWEVASIVWSPGDRRVQPINRFYELPPN